MGIGSVVGFILLMLTVTQSAGAADITVNLTTTNNQVADGEAIQLDVTVEGSRSAEKPTIENTSDFDIQTTGTSTRFQMVNGSVSSSVVYSYELMPKHAGTFTVGPASVVVGGKTYQSGTAQIIVAKAGAPSTNSAAADADGGAPSNASNRSLVLKADVDNKKPYVGQQMVYTFRLYNRARVQNAQLSLPDFGGFWKEEIEKQKDSERAINGVLWHISELKFALFPQNAGKLTIDPASLVGEVVVQEEGQNSPFDQFFNGMPFGFGGGRLKRIKVQSEPLNIAVQNLPEKGKPANFSGLVGHFTVKTSMSRRELAVGDSGTLTVQIEGDGNVRDAKLPDAALDGFKVYDDKPVAQTHVEGTKIAGSQTFKRALVPLKAGDFQIPAIQISYFDPTTAAYRTAEAPGVSLKVTPGSGGETPEYAGQDTSSKRPTGPAVEDIMPLKTVPSHWGSRPFSKTGSRLAWFLILFPPIGFGLFFLGRRSWLARRNDRVRGRKRKAYRNFQGRLQTANDQSSYHGEFSGLIREYLGDKGNFDGKALTPEDAKRRLGGLGVSQATAQRVVSFLESCERGLYGGGGGGEDKERLQSEMIAIVDALEKEMGS